MTIMKYNSLNFDDEMLGLDATFQSIGGPVSADRIQRENFFGIILIVFIVDVLI